MHRPAATAPKPQWRRWAKRVRADLPLQRLSDEVVATILAWPRYKEAQHVLTYEAFGSEIDLGALQDGEKTFYLARTWGVNEVLTVHPVTGELELHPLGYLQPKASAPQVSAELIDLALIPGLCFDQAGTRLGYGGGFYDRFLRGLREDAPRVGITAQDLVVTSLPREAFDIPMSHLATEAGISVIGC